MTSALPPVSENAAENAAENADKTTGSATPKPTAAPSPAAAPELAAAPEPRPQGSGSDATTPPASLASAQAIMDLEREYVLQNYARYPLMLARGKGPYVYDGEG